MGAGFRAISLPDLPSIPLPSTPPGSQTGWDTFAPPITANAIPAAVTITECTRKVGSLQQMQITGDGFTSGTSFAFYGQSTSGNGTLISDTAQLLQLLLDTSNNLATWLVPTQMPVGAIMVWPVISRVAGYPQILNTPICNWCQDMSTGLHASVIPATVSIYGINLCNTYGQTWVLVEVVSGTYAQTILTNYTGGTGIVNANENRVQFTMPSNISPHGAISDGETVRFWVHNGRGDSRGWSRVPYDITKTSLVTLKLNYPSSGSTINPSNSGTASSTDTSNLTTRISSIGSSGGNIQLGSGTFYLNSIIFTGGFNSGISLEGQGIDVTIIKPVTGGYVDAFQNTFAYFNALGRLKNLTIDLTDSYWTSFSATGATCNSYTNVKIINPNSGTVAINTVQNGSSSTPGVWSNLTINAVLPTQQPSAIISEIAISGLIINQANNGATFTSEAAINTDAMLYTSIDNSGVAGTAFTMDTSTVCGGRMIVVEGSIISCYYDSLTSSLAGISGRGEQLFIGEQEADAYWTTGLSSDSTGTTTVVTFGSTPPAVNKVVHVVLGKGIGQCGVVTSVDNINNKATLDRLWRVDLDSTSRLLTGLGTQYLIVRNCQPGCSDGSSSSSSTGIQTYQLTAYVHINGLKSTGMGGSGYSIGANVGISSPESINKITTNLWIFNENPTVTDCYHYETIWDFASTTDGFVPSHPVNIGVLIYGAICTSPGLVALTAIQADSAPSVIDLIGHDNCMYIDVPVGVQIGENSYRDVWWNVKILPQNASGSKGWQQAAGHGTATDANIIARGMWGAVGFAAQNIQASP